MRRRAAPAIQPGGGAIVVPLLIAVVSGLVFNAFTLLLPKPSVPLAAHPAGSSEQNRGIEFAPDSPLEESGFELLVPP
jgi:hypothetical protein